MPRAPKPARSARVAYTTTAIVVANVSRPLPKGSRGSVRKELESLRGWVNSMLAVVRG